MIKGVLPEHKETPTGTPWDKILDKSQVKTFKKSQIHKLSS